jgi:F-type H+-transporting ATPase subunit b
MARSSVLGLALLAALAVAQPAVADEEHGTHADTAAEGEAHHAAEDAAHGEHAEHGSLEINWAYGLLGEKDGVEPDLLYRPKGMPPPFLANVINFAILVAIILSVGKKPIAEALKKRKERIVAGMEEAGRMKDEAATRLAEYEDKLKRLDDEIERIKREMRESAEAERKRTLGDAKERRDRMEREAKVLVEQELKAAREALMRETVMGAMRSAADVIANQLGTPDHERLAREYLEMLQKTPLPNTGARS